MKKLSRGPQVDMEKCIAGVGGNRFDLAMIAAYRAKEITKSRRFGESYNQTGAAVDALLEINEGKDLM